MSFFSEDLIDSIKSRSLAPISQSTFDDEKLLKMANEELQLKLVSDLIKVREDFFLTSEDLPLISNVNYYSIPDRAIGNGLKQVFYKASNSNTKKPLVKVDQERSQYYSENSGEPEKFYFMGDEIVLLPTPSAAFGSINFVFPANPNSLTLTSNCAKITSSSSSDPTASFMVSTDLTGSLSVGDFVDFVSTKSPFKLWTYKAQITQITSNQIDVALNAVSNINGTIEPQVNDYICPSGTSNIPQIPIAYHPILSQMVVVRLMESLGDLNKLGAAKATLMEMRMDAGMLIKNRVENSPDRINTRKSLKNYFR